MKTALTLILLVIFALPVFGEEAERPKFRKPPTVYIYRHTVQDASGKRVDAKDELLIGDRDNHKLTFWFYITGPNFHGCSLAGEATGRNGSDYLFADGECALTIKIRGRGAYLLDPNNECLKNYCGMYAVINGTKFLKKR
jgi:hypothetical protein